MTSICCNTNHASGPPKHHSPSPHLLVTTPGPSACWHVAPTRSGGCCPCATVMNKLISNRELFYTLLFIKLHSNLLPHSAEKQETSREDESWGQWVKEMHGVAVVEGFIALLHHTRDKQGVEPFLKLLWLDSLSIASPLGNLEALPGCYVLWCRSFVTMSSIIQKLYFPLLSFDS